MQVGEVTSATTRHEDFLADLVRTFEHDNAAATSPRHNGAHQSRGTATQDNYVVIIHGGNIAGEAAMWCHYSKNVSGFLRIRSSRRS